ncbi:hypothetical protein GIB67_008342 [Kingdonia uniflora]|uniref:Uncharacterized protein n=1 Tax=Kingdonia uniflora TaxID=39325 RepID=A0A7J7N519_9MAGN|nr:hypothetical protein GIB67_008342 [Kingdonia uniflora]
MMFLDSLLSNAICMSMGLDIELEFDKYCKVVQHPKVSRTSHRHGSKHSEGNEKRSLISKSCHMRGVNDDFMENSGGKSRNSFCERVTSESDSIAGDEVPKRGSIYQNSKEVGKKMEALECRRKIEISSCTENVISSDGFLEICVESEDIRTFKQLSMKCDQSIGPLSDGNGILERDLISLHKSSSEKARIPYKLFLSESDNTKSCSKTRFSPFRKMLDPFMKSKSQRNLPISVEELGNDSPGIRRIKAFRKSLLHDFSDVEYELNSSSVFVEKNPSSVSTSSPAHLHGVLNLEFKQGVPFFEFSLENPEDILAAKTWKTDNAFNWIYTFHSRNSRRKSNSSKRGAKVRQKESSLIGQMQVSCYLCSEMRNDRAFDYSKVTEFVVYDMAHVRKNFSTQESLDDFESVTPDPWESTDLSPSHETAAVLFKVPFEARQTSKDKRREEKLDISNCRSQATVKVVASSGNHGLPRTEEGGAPSPLLERWRSGGVCDCGGWDMACPLVIFNSPSVPNVTDHHHPVENQQPFLLFVQGTREKSPALTMKPIGEGLFSVDFHAQLSTLQAFSICVAILHNSEVFTGVVQSKNMHRLQCSSLKMLIEEEVKFLIETVSEEEKKKITKRVNEIPATFLLNPPFSPVSRA